MALAVLFLLLDGIPTLRAGNAPEEIRIGYLLSRREGFNTSDRAGATLGAEEMNAQAAHLGKRFTILFAEGGLSSEVVAEATRLIEQEGVRVLMGSVSDAATIALARLARERDVVFLDIGSPVESLRGEKCERHAFSVGPSLTMGVRALGQWALLAKGWKRWAVIAGESNSEQDLAAAARAYLAANGGEVAGVIRVDDAQAHAPAPILAEVKRLAPDFVFVALTGERQTLVLGGYKASGLAFPIGGTLPEVVRFDRDHGAAMGYWSAAWNHLLEPYGASELNNRFVAHAALRMDDRAWAAWAGVKIVGEALLRTEDGSAAALMTYLRERSQFDGYKGVPLTFRPWDQQLRQPLYIVRVNESPDRNGWDTLVPVETLPLRGLKGAKGDPLDSLALGREESACKW